MGRISVTVATILVLANCGSISWADASYHAGNHVDELIVLMDDNSSSYQPALHAGATPNFGVGDLEAGIQTGKDQPLSGRYKIDNTKINTVMTYQMKILSPHGKFNWVKIFNNVGSKLVACETANTLGSKTSVINVRIDGYNTADITISASVEKF